MISKQAFKNLVDLVVQKTGKNQEQLAIDMGYGKNYISELTTPSGTVSKKFFEAFKLRHREVLENPKVEKTGMAKASFDALDPSDLIKAIQTLADSNQGLVESNKIALNNNKTALETNQVIADTNRVLAMKLVKEDTNSVGGQLSDIDRASILVPLAEVMAGIASGELKYSTKAEAIAELGIKLNLHKPGKGSRERNEVGAGKKGIV